MNALKQNTSLTRRGFLVRTGWVAAGVTVLSACSSILPALPETAEPVVGDGLAWLQMLPGGRVRFFCPRMEMGQGASVGLSQIVAEELNIDAAGIDCVVPNTDQTPPFKMTVGSESILEFFDPVSYGAARLRETLRALAAKKENVAVSKIKDGPGGFVLPDGRKLDYADLVPAEPVVVSDDNVEPPVQYAKSKKGQYTAIGHRWKSQQLSAIVTGREVFSQDVSIGGMVYGHVVRAPRFGAVLKGADITAAETMPGVLAVVIDQPANFAGLVVDQPFHLAAAVAALKLDWQGGEDLDQAGLNARLDVETFRAADDFEHTLLDEGDVGAARGRAKATRSARYDTPLLAHAAIEPRASVAWVRRDRAEIWCGGQDPFFVQRRVAKMLGRSEGDITVHSHRIGGGFGGRVLCLASEEAARLSAAVGKPVRVQWDRGAEFQNNYLQPAYSHFIDAGVTDDGRISHWDHDFIGSPIITGLAPKSIAWIIDAFVADEGTARGGLPPYQVSDQRVRYGDIRTEVFTGAWRGLGTAPNTFAIESMIDELAAAAGIDPLSFRLNNLSSTETKMAGVLNRVAALSQWGKTLPDGVGRGVACGAYKGLTPVAVVAEVFVDKAKKAISVRKVWCVQDCGLVINPSQVEAQVMGNIVWGCSLALKERLSVKGGAIEQRNFDDYEILRHDETPEMVIEWVDAPDAHPQGVGESAFGPVAPAIANAIFAATGQRARRLPIRYNSIFPDTSG